MLSQDILSRIVNVNWPGGLMMVVWVQGLKFGIPGNPSPPDPDLDILFKSSLSWFNFGSEGKSYKSSSLTEKTRDPGSKALFDTSPFKLESFPYYEERDATTSSQTYTVKDQVRYWLINGHSGETISFCTNELLGQSIPFYVSFNGYPLFDPSGTQPSYASPPTSLLAPFGDGIATECGLSGFNWHPLENEVLASHEETSSFTNKAFNGNRFLFINLSKLISEVDNLTTFTIDVHAQFVPGIDFNTKQTYLLNAMVGIYNKAQQDAKPPPPGPTDPGGWPVVTGNQIDTGGLLNNLNGSPAFVPPNFDSSIVREPIGPSAFLVEDITSGEGPLPPGKIRFTVDLTGESPALSSEIIFDFEP